MNDAPHHVRVIFSSLRFRGARPEELRTLSESEWKDILARWDLDRFTMPLRQTWGDVLPDWVRAKIDRDIQGNSSRFERIKADYSKIANAIREAGVEHLVLKGFSQWPGYVEHPRLRPQSDIDLYCPPDSITQAKDALAVIGYQPVGWIGPGPSDHVQPLMQRTDWKWRGDFFDPAIPIAVELHFRLWDQESSGVGPKDLEQFWSRRVVRSLDEISFPSFNAVDGLGYFSLHILRDLLRGYLRTANLFELARFLHTNANDESLWANWLDLHEPSLRSLQAISCRLAAHVFDCQLSGAVQEEIDRMPVAVNAWFERFSDSPLNNEFKLNKDLVWLNLSLLKSSRQKCQLFFNRLLPPRITQKDAPYIYKPGDDESKYTPLQKRTKYLGYLASRVGYHARILPRSLWNGARWWLATKNVGKGLWTFLASSFFFAFGMYVFFLLYNLYLLDHGFKESFLGLVASASAIGGIVGTVPAGIFAQRFGLRKALFVCLTIAPVVSALRTLIGNQTALLVLAFLAGAVTSIWAVCLAPAVAQLTDQHNRPFGFSLIFSSGIGIGVLGGLVGGRLPDWLSRIGTPAADLHAKQLALLVACGMMAIAVWPVSRLHFTSAPTEERKLYSRNPILLRYLPAIAVWSLALGAFGPFANAYLSQHLRLPVHQIGSIFSLSQLSQLLAVLAAPIIFRKLGLVTGIVYMQIATALGLACLAAAPSASAAAAIYIGYTAFQWMSEPGMFTLLMNQMSAEERTGASTLNFLVINVSQAIAAAVAGGLFVRLGYPAVIRIAAGCALVAALLFRFLLGNARLTLSQPSHVNVEAEA
jgi:MFS family permease